MEKLAKLAPYLGEVGWTVLEVGAFVLIVAGVLVLAGLGWSLVVAGGLLAVVVVVRAVLLSFPRLPKAVR